VNLVSQLSTDERRRGVICASTGNHGQSVAYAADLFGVRAVICMPEQANPVKVESMRALGAEVIFHGRDFDEAREHCEKLATEHGYRYIHSGNEPDLVAGVATYTLEILEARPGIEVIVVPVGGGSGAAGACLVAKAVRPSVQVIGVQSEAAPAAYRSWQAGSLVDRTRLRFDFSHFAGVAEEELAQIFDAPCFRGGSPAPGTSGLELTIARLIAERSGGRHQIRVE